MDAHPFGPETGPTGEYARLAEQVVRDPGGAWSRLLEITAAVDDAGLYWVADILEDLVIHDPDRFAPLIEQELETNARLRRAFVFFVPTTSDDVLAERLVDLRERIEQDATA
jgi:hypothetical protein